MKKATFVVLALALLVPFPCDAADDEDEPLEPGSRVRVAAPAPQTARGTRVTDQDFGESKKTVSFLSEDDVVPRTYTLPGQDVTGTLIRVTDDAIVLETKNGQRSIQVPRAALTKLEVSVAPSRKKRGAAYGALAGLGAALIFAAIISDPDKLLGEFSVSFATGAILFIPSGAVVGAIVAPGERWQPGMLDAPAPQFGLAFAIKF